MKMNIKELEQWARQFTIDTWGQELNIPVLETSKRVRRYNGLFEHTGALGLPRCIKLSLHLLKREEDILSTLKHELAHWYCYTNGLQYKDGSEDFERTLLEIGAGSSGVRNGSYSEWQQTEQLKGNIGGNLYHKDVRIIKQKVPTERCVEIFNRYSDSNLRSLNKTHLSKIYFEDKELGHILYFDNGFCKGYIPVELKSELNGGYWKTRKNAIREFLQKEFQNI